MGNISPRQSKSYHDGFSNHLTLTPNRSSSSWKKQLQIINDTLNIKKFSLRHTHGKHKRYRTDIDENNNNNNHHHSLSTQNFRDISKKFPKQRDMNVKKSLSLFTIKQPLNDSTNKENQEQQSLNSTVNYPVQPKRRSTGNY
jgi:hypothetical protein